MEADAHLVALAALASALGDVASRDDALAAIVAHAGPAAGLERAEVVPVAAGVPADVPEAVRRAAAGGEIATAHDGGGTIAAVPLVDLKGEVLAVVALVADRHVVLDDARVAAVRLVAELAGTALRRLQLGVRATALAALAAGLAGAVTTVEVAAALAAHGLEPLGARLLNCRVLDATGTVLESILPSMLDPELAERYDRIPLARDFPLSEAVRTDAPVWVSDRDELGARYPAILPDAEAAGFGALAAVPLHDGTGAVIGALALAWSGPIRFDAVIRSSVLTIADLAAQALDRARLTDDRTRDARTLADLAGALATAVSRDEVAVAVAEHVAPVVAAARARVEAPPGPGSALGLDREAGVARVGVCDAGDRTIGLLVVEWDGGPPGGDDLEVRLGTVAELIGQTLERAILYDGQHELVQALQHRLLGSTELPTTVDAATRYLPASRSVGIGGDWFDLVPTGASAFQLVVGDVTGHGVDAVTTMAQLRALITGTIRAGAPLESLFSQVEAMLSPAERVLVTAQAFAVDTAARRLRYSSAGHPWALLAHADGRVTTLDAAQGTLLGVGARDRRVAEVDLQAGDVLVAYTDGLVERRREPISAGIDRLAATLASLDRALGADAVADAVLAASGIEPDATLDDDVALVVLRFR